MAAKAQSACTEYYSVYVFPDIFPSPKNFQGPGVLPKGSKVYATPEYASWAL